MTIFIILGCLLTSFLLGLILGRWLKRILCHNRAPSQANLAADSTSRTDTASYGSTADRLALRDKVEHNVSSNPSEADGSLSKAAMATGSVATLGAAAYALAEGDDEGTTAHEKTVQSDRGELPFAARAGSMWNASTSRLEVAEKPYYGNVAATAAAGATLGAAAYALAENDKDSVTDEAETTGSAINSEVVNTDNNTPPPGELPFAARGGPMWNTPTNRLEVPETPYYGSVVAAAGTTATLGAIGHALTGDESSTTAESSIAKDPSSNTTANKQTASHTKGNQSGRDTIYSSIAGIDPRRLQVIEGIGPKMESILHENDILTWRDLSVKTAEDIRAILDQYGNQYKGVEDLPLWSEQAQLAADGMVDELIDMQHSIHGAGVSKIQKKFGVKRSDDIG